MEYKTKLLLLLFIACTHLLFSQTELSISDTSKIKYFTLRGDDRDTSYYIKDPFSQGKYMVYYDDDKKIKAFEVEVEKVVPEKLENYDGNKLLNEKSWYRNGKVKLISKVNKNKDTLFTTKYYQNGNIKNKIIQYWVAYQNIWGLISEEDFYLNGQIKSTPINFSLKIKQHINGYYENGVKKYELNWANGIEVGEYKDYYENGQLKKSGLCLDTLDSSMLSGKAYMETGKWSYYNENGKLIKEELYENGELIKTTEK